MEGYVRVQGLATDEAPPARAIPSRCSATTEAGRSRRCDVGSLIDSIYGTETRAPYLGTTNSYGYTVSNFLNILYAGETESSLQWSANPVDFDDEYLSVRNAFNNQGGNSISTLVFSLTVTRATRLRSSIPTRRQRIWTRSRRSDCFVLLRKCKRMAYPAPAWH